MTQIQPDDFSKLEYSGWQRVADKYMDNWAKLTRQFIEPLLDAAYVNEGMKVPDVERKYSRIECWGFDILFFFRSMMLLY